MALNAKQLAEKCKLKNLSYDEACKVFSKSAYRGFYKTFSQLSSEENWKNYLFGGKQNG